MTFIEILDDLLQKKGVSAHKMCLELKLNKNAVSAWREKGNLPNGETLIKLSDYFKVSIDSLVGRTDNPAPPQIIRAAQPSKGKGYEDIKADLVRLEEEVRKLKERSKK